MNFVEETEERLADEEECAASEDQYDVFLLHSASSQSAFCFTTSSILDGNVMSYERSALRIALLRT